MMKKIIIGACVGIALGQVLSLIFSVIYGQYSPGVPSFLAQFDNDIGAVAVQTVIFAAIGVIQALASDVFANLDRYSLLKATSIHFAAIVLPLMITAYVLHWSTNLAQLSMILIGVIIIYMIIWIMMYSYYKGQIKKINEHL